MSKKDPETRPLTPDDISPIFDDEFVPLPGVSRALGYILDAFKRNDVVDISHIDPNGIMSHDEVQEIANRKYDLSPTPENIKPVIAKAGQVAINSAQRQFWVNTKDMIDSDTRPPEEFRKNPLKKPIDQFKKNPLVFVGGYSSRAILQFSGIFPALQFRDNVLDKDESIVTKTAATATIESAVGSFMEPKSLQKNLARDGYKLPTGVNFPITAGTLFFPYLVRNSLTWFAVNSDEKNLGIKAGYGFVAGMLGGPFDTVANNIMRIPRMDNEAIIEGTLRIWGQSWKKMCKTSPTALVAAAACRGIGNGVAAPLLSPEVRDFFVKAQEQALAAFQTLYSAATNQLMAVSSIVNNDDPKTAISSNEHNKIAGDQSQTRDPK